MDTPTHYELLCVTPDATADDVRAAYRRLIRMYHPDVAGTAGEAMTLRLNEAQSALLDPVSRGLYDRRRSYATAGAGSRREATNDERRPHAHTEWHPKPGPHPTPKPTRNSTPKPTVFRPVHARAWLWVAITAIVIILAATAIVFVYFYSAPLDFATPRIVAPMAIAIAWVVAGIRRPAKIFISLLVVSALLWPLSLARVEPFRLLGSSVSAPILALLTLTGLAVIALRVAGPRSSAPARARI